MAASETNVTFFGRLAETVGAENIILPAAEDTDSLLREILARFPALSESPLIVAVDRRTVTANTPLKPDSEVVLMPPYSGG